uniref:Uncharacterized protein n=1 Tax=Arundo donax TaxID=35708 RepID=A0A0A9HGL8_ARUDO
MLSDHVCCCPWRPRVRTRPTMWPTTSCALVLWAYAKAAGHVAPGLAVVSSTARPSSSGTYFAFNQIVTFLRFAHLTANQACDLLHQIA